MTVHVIFNKEMQFSQMRFFSHHVNNHLLINFKAFNHWVQFLPNDNATSQQSKNKAISFIEIKVKSYKKKRDSK